MREEDNILRKAGLENPFQVPDGYFDNLTAQVMDKLPEKEVVSATQQEPTMWQKVKPLLYMAAMFAGAALLIRVGSSDKSVANETLAMDETEQEIVYISQMVNASMMDDYSLYVYLTDEEE